jgi:hypothetical protein
MHEILYLQALIAELYEPIIPPIPVYCDNQGALALATNNKFHACTKHIDIQYHYVQSLIYLTRRYQGHDSQCCKQVYD